MHGKSYLGTSRVCLGAFRHQGVGAPSLVPEKLELLVDPHMDLQPKFISPGWCQNLQTINLNERDPRLVMSPSCLAKSKCRSSFGKDIVI